MTSKLSVLLLSGVVACSTGKTKEEQATKAVAERNDSPDAEACRGREKFWDATSKACMEDFELAKFECATSQLDSIVLPASKETYEATKAEGYAPLSCGVKYSGTPQVLTVSWTKEASDGVLFRTEQYFVDTEPTKPTGASGTDTETDQKTNEQPQSQGVNLYPLLGDGTWERCEIDPPAYAQKYAVTFTADGFVETRTVYDDQASCDDSKKKEEEAKTGTWSEINEGTGADMDPYAMKFAMTKIEQTYFMQQWVDANNTGHTCGFTDWAVGVKKDVTTTDAFCSLDESDKEDSYLWLSLVEGKLKIDGGHMGGSSASSTILRQSADLSSEPTFTKAP